MIGYICRQLATGAALATLLIGAMICFGGSGVDSLAAEALRSPSLIPALWLGAVAPFAIGFLATALCLCPGTDNPPSGPAAPARCRYGMGSGARNSAAA